MESTIIIKKNLKNLLPEWCTSKGGDPGRWRFMNYWFKQKPFIKDGKTVGCSIF